MTAQQIDAHNKRQEKLYPLLRERMRSFQFTGEILSHQIGNYSRGYISDRLNGKVPWTLEDMYKVCDCLNIAPFDAYMFFPPNGKETKRRPPKQISHEGMAANMLAEMISNNARELGRVVEYLRRYEKEIERPC